MLNDVIEAMKKMIGPDGNLFLNSVQTKQLVTFLEMTNVTFEEYAKTIEMLKTRLEKDSK